MRTFKTSQGTELRLIDLKGKDYLPVQQRLIWFREEHPDWAIITEIVHKDEKSSVVKATIYDPTGRPVSTAHKEESKLGFGDFLEKSETGAIGRALANCGYGTQFASEEFEEGERIADAPVERRAIPPAGEVAAARSPSLKSSPLISKKDYELLKELAGKKKCGIQAAEFMRKAFDKTEAKTLNKAEYDQVMEFVEAFPAPRTEIPPVDFSLSP